MLLSRMITIPVLSSVRTCAFTRAHQVRLGQFGVIQEEKRKRVMRLGSDYECRRLYPDRSLRRLGLDLLDNSTLGVSRNWNLLIFLDYLD
jgi:hypothetical protein